MTNKPEKTSTPLIVRINRKPHRSASGPETSIARVSPQNDALRKMPFKEKDIPSSEAMVVRVTAGTDAMRLTVAIPAQQTANTIRGVELSVDFIVKDYPSINALSLESPSSI